MKEKTLLIREVIENGKTISAARKILGLKSSTAKRIIKKYKKDMNETRGPQEVLAIESHRHENFSQQKMSPPFH